MDHFKIQVNIPIAVLEQKLRNECLKAIKELINWIMHVKSMTYTIQSIKIHKQEFYVADDILDSKASQIALNPNLPDYERKDARLVTGIMGVKSRFGMGIKKNTNEEKLTNIYYDPKTGYSGIDSIARKSGIKRSEVVKWLTQQNVYSLHKPIRHRFKKEDLWRLLTLKDAGKFEDYTVDVRHAYIDIMNKTKAHLNEEGKLHIAPRSKKYNDVIKPVFIAFMKKESKRHAEKIRQTRVEQKRRL